MAALRYHASSQAIRLQAPEPPTWLQALNTFQVTPNGSMCGKRDDTGVLCRRLWKALVPHLTSSESRKETQQSIIIKSSVVEAAEHRGENGALRNSRTLGVVTTANDDNIAEDMLAQLFEHSLVSHRGDPLAIDEQRLLGERQHPPV